MSLSFFVYNLLVVPRFMPRLGDILFISILAGAMLLGQRMLNIDSDLGRHLAQGRYILVTGRVPTVDIFSFTRAGQSRPPYEWFSQVILAGAHRSLALDGVVLVIATAIAAAYALTFGESVARSGSPLISLILSTWAAWAGSIHWLTRPHVFTFVLFVVWISLLERLRLGSRAPLWQLPMVMLVWANVHGGFIVGFIAWGAYLAGVLWENRRGAPMPSVGSRLLLAGLLSAVASIVTPTLWNNWIAVLRNSSVYVLQRTAETASPSLEVPGFWPFFALLAAGAMLGWFGRRRVVASHMLLLLVLAMLGLVIARNIPLFGLAAAPVLASWATSTFPQASRFLRLEHGLLRMERASNAFIWPPVAVIVTTALLVGFNGRSGGGVYRFDPAVMPVRAGDWLVRNPQWGKMFNELNWGGYLLYRLWPDQRVFIDSQSDFYGEDFIREYDAVVGGSPTWEAILSDHSIGWVIVKTSSPLASRLRSTSGWDAVFEDGMSVIFIRTPQYAEGVALATAGNAAVAGGPSE